MCPHEPMVDSPSSLITTIIIRYINRVITIIFGTGKSNSPTWWFSNKNIHYKYIYQTIFILYSKLITYIYKLNKNFYSYFDNYVKKNLVLKRI